MRFSCVYGLLDYWMPFFTIINLVQDLPELLHLSIFQHALVPFGVFSASLVSIFEKSYVLSEKISNSLSYSTTYSLALLLFTDTVLH